MTQNQLKPDGRWRSHLQHGHTRGMKYSPTYHSWQAMHQRVRYKRHNSDSYAAVSVCDRWESFDNFLADMGERPNRATLERKDNKRGYEPGNCIWATPTQQARNRRNAKLTFDSTVGVALRMLAGEPARVVAADNGISESLPREILKGRTWKDALAEARRIHGA